MFHSKGVTAFSGRLLEGAGTGRSVPPRLRGCARRHLVRSRFFEERFRIIVRRAADIICKTAEWIFISLEIETRGTRE
jgi:hypothetical protein